MHLERRLRAEGERQSASIPVDVERSLATVIGAARRRQRFRRAWIGAATITFMAIGTTIGAQLLSPVQELRSDVPASLPSPASLGQTLPTSAAPQVVAFGRVVHPGLAVVRANGLAGRWTIEVDEHGPMWLRMPEAFAGRRDSPLEVVGGQLTTTAFDHGLCRGEPAGVYRWTRIQGFLVLDRIADGCDARVWILTSTPWGERF